MWSNGRIVYENGAILSVTSGLGYPDEGAGSNEQCLQMFFEGPNKTGMLKHDDHYRGVIHSYLEGIGPGGTHHKFDVSPDFMQFVPWEGPGFRPEGYGFKSVASIVQTAQFIEGSTAGLGEKEALAARQRGSRRLTPRPAGDAKKQRRERVIIEAGRESICNGGRSVRIAGR